MDDLQARQDTPLDRLLRHRERPGDDRLAGDDRHGGRQDHQRQAQPGRREHVERAFQRRRPHPRQQRALAHIIEHQRRQHEEQPRHADRAAPEMPHVGIERLRPRHRQHDGAERQKRAERVDREELDGIVRRQRP